MPNGDVLKIRMLISDVRDGVLQSMRKTFLVGLKACPATLEL